MMLFQKLHFVDIVDQEKHPGSRHFDNIYKRDMKGLVGDLVKLWTVYVHCSARIFMALNYFILIIKIYVIYMCLGEKLVIFS